MIEPNLMPDEELREIAARCVGLTEGPWGWDGYTKIYTTSIHKGHRLDIAEPDEPTFGVVLWVNSPSDFHGDAIGCCGEPECVRNAEFAAHSRTDIPALLAHIAALEGERPYWLWRALLESKAERRCVRVEGGADCVCSETGDCITEWCIVCAAQAFLSAILKKEDTSNG